MVYKEQELNRLISRLIERIKEKIPVHKVILFGSYAMGCPEPHSDLDLAIVSPAFEGMSDTRRLTLLSRTLRHFPLPHPLQIELLGFTENDLAEGDYFDIEGEIFDKGKVVYSSRC